MKKYDVIIIGAGPGGIFSAYELLKSNENLKIAVFEEGHTLEKRKCPIDGKKIKSCIHCKSCSIMSGFGGAGAFSDGKYNITNDFGGTLYEYIGKEKALELMKLVGITDAEKRIKNYPHQLSGGMRQRIVIAIALACDPDLLICDEPTTALDVTIQSKILELIQEIQKKRQLSVIYITHDLGVVAKVADYVNVMYAGKIVESGTVEDVFYDPRHPYTWGLLSAMPDLGTDDERLYTIPGSPPNLLHKVTGDAFAPRNKYALNIDSRLEPPMFKISETHSAATWLLHPKAPKVDMPPELRDRIERMKKEGGIA